MTACYCLTPVLIELRAIKHPTVEALRAIVRRQPATCDREGCAPGGCRKHVGEYLGGVAVKINEGSKK